MNTLDNKRTILLIDGYHLLHKGYYGSLKRKKIATNRDGVTINAIYTFVAKIKELIDKDEYYTIIVTLDAEGCWRREIYPEYKAKRKETPPDLIPQMQVIREFLTMAKIPWYEKQNFEGDDVIGTIVRIANKCDYDVHILSNDKDTYQLVNDKTKVITNASKQEDHILVSEAEVYEKFNCNPVQVPDMKALLGDPSDNIKGVKGLHFTQAVQLLSQFENVEDILSNVDKITDLKLRTKIIDGKELIEMNKSITKILDNVQLEKINLKPLRVNWYGFLRFLKKHKMWVFTGSVLSKIQELESEK